MSVVKYPKKSYIKSCVRAWLNGQDWASMVSELNSTDVAEFHRLTRYQTI